MIKQMIALDPQKSNLMILPAVKIWPIALLALLIGGFIYIFLRPAPPIFFHWIQRIGVITEWLEAVRLNTLTITPYLPMWVVYSLPQGLWAFSYTLIMVGIWGRKRNLLAIFWLGTIPLLVFGFEVLQLAGEIRGTYCPEDMLFSAAGILLGVLASVRLRKQ